MSTWGRDEDRLLLVELATIRGTRERVAQAGALRHLADLRWITRTTRAREWALDPAFLRHVEALLDREWPVWRQVRDSLGAAGFAPTPEGYAAWRDRERIASTGELPDQLHQKTWAALTGAHSKVGRSLRRAPEADGPLLTTGQVVRLRPSAGLAIVQGDLTLDASTWASMNGGEVVLTERALRAGTGFGGRPPHAIVTIENLGAYLDLPAPEGFAFVHVPGWDSTLARLLLANVTSPLVHFGDLDPAGVRIARHLAEVFPSMRWWVPSFAPEYFDAHAQACEWPEVVESLPAPVEALARSGRWLEQEALVLDPRSERELRALVGLAELASNTSGML